MIEMVKKRRLIWSEHVERMEVERLPISALQGHVKGKKSRGRQSKIWMHNIRGDLKE